jgi:Protein of unknown function (DUF3606)
MADNKSKVGKQDRERVNVHEDYELRDWAKHFGVSKEKLIEIEKKVGPMAKDIQAALGK